MKCQYCGEQMNLGKRITGGYYDPPEQQWICPHCHAEAWTDYCSIYWEQGNERGIPGIVEDTVKEVSDKTGVKINYKFDNKDVIFTTSHDKIYKNLFDIEYTDLKDTLLDLVG